MLLGLWACGGGEAQVPSSPELVQQSAPLVCGRLNANESLNPGQSRWSCAGAVELRHQTDGNVVAYDRQGVLWATYTNGRATTRLTMQADGNLVLYNGSTPVWNSQTSNRPGAFLGIQDDCNLVIYHNNAPAWATYTFCRAGPPTPSGFVSASGGNFYLNGKRFKHVGINTPQLVYQPVSQVTSTLDQAKAAGIRHVRVFLPNDAMQGSVWDPKEIRDRLRVVLDAALQRDIRVTVALAHNYYQKVWGWEGRDGRHIVPGDSGYYTRSFENLLMLNDLWIQSGYQRPGGSYKDFAWAIASAFKDHAGVFAWDIANETNVSGTSSTLLDSEVAFYRDMAKMLKQADPNHMVTTGLISTSWAGLDDARRKLLYEDPNIDYVVVHEYDDDNQHDEYADIWRAKQWFTPRKPVIVEEAGIKAAKTNFNLMKEYFRKLYDDHGVDAVLQWGVQFSCPANGNTEDWGGGDAFYGPCEQGRLTDYKALWKTWSTTLQTRNNQ